MLIEIRLNKIIL